MGTTLDVVLIAGPEAFVAHVGDSRTYLVRDGRSSQITTDHTVAEVLVIEGKLTIEEAQVSPLRTILVNAIGVSADVGVEMAHVTLKRGDRLLLCSDGLHDYFPIEEEIAQKLSAAAPGDALKDMVELAKTRGGHDNITGVAVQVTEIIDAVPATLDSDLTQPVDAPGTNPFASDEPTETALVEPAGITTRVVSPAGLTPSQLKATQPMRIVEDGEDGDADADADADAATADTLPPPEPPRLDPPPDGPPRAAADAEPDDNRDDNPDDNPDDKMDETVEVDPVASSRRSAAAATVAEAKAEADHDGVTPIADGAKPVDPDGELPDTGRARANNDKDAG
jgi:hypothetical protein